MPCNLFILKLEENSSSPFLTKIKQNSSLFFGPAFFLLVKNPDCAVLCVCVLPYMMCVCVCTCV